MVFEQTRRLSAFLWNPEIMLPNEVHGKVNGRLTGSLEIQDDRVWTLLFHDRLLGRLDE